MPRPRRRQQQAAAAAQQRYPEPVTPGQRHFDPNDPEAEHAAAASDLDGEAEPEEEVDEDLERERERAERAERNLEAALRGGRQSAAQPARDPEPEPQALPEMPDPVQDPTAYRAWMAQAGNAIADQATRSIRTELSQRDRAQRAEQMVRDFVDEYPEFKPLGMKRIRGEFAIATDWSGDLPTDAEAAKLRVKEQLDTLRGHLNPQPGTATPAGGSSRTVGTSAGTRRVPRAKKSADEPTTPSSFTDQLQSMRESWGI